MYSLSCKWSKILKSALSVTWASTSTVILAPPPVYVEPCRAVSQHCDSFVIYVATLLTTAFVLSWSRSSNLSSITATSCLSDFLPISNNVCRRYSTPQFAWYLFRLRRYHVVWCPGAHSIPSVERYGSTVSESTRSGIKPARSSPSAVVVHAAAAHPAVPSVNSRPSLAHSPSQPLFSGTFSQTKCSLHRLSLPSGDSWRHSCFTSHFRTSLFKFPHYAVVDFATV